MLAKSDVNIQKFIPIFAELNVPVAFLVPTETGFEKSIMDATGTVRAFLKSSGIHDYELQNQGPESKVSLDCYFVLEKSTRNTTVSLYRPNTKKGDPRIWFSGLKTYCSPYNLLALISIYKQIYVINLSNTAIQNSLLQRGFVYDLLKESVFFRNAVAEELRAKIKTIHDIGFIPSITSGDPGVGDTLENALGISRNNLQAPDYKGIELKATRLSRNGNTRPTTRSTLFTKVPDEGLTYRQIVEKYGKFQTPRGMTSPRFQLYETFRVSRPNAYDLILEVDSNNDKLKMLHVTNANIREYVSSWIMENLRELLLTKHHETFWVKAVSELREGKEYFRYDKIEHTKNPNASLLGPLIDSGIITLDLAAHIDDKGKWRDHGLLFKISPKDLPLLLGTPAIYDLT